ncbi:jockey\pol [Symbiodinium sp. CCMP2592]|nr:jockey\pol [Symbiodinium sp. CCMP2592]
MSRTVGKKRAEPLSGENVSIPASSDDENVDAPSPAKIARAKEEDRAVTVSDLKAIMLEQTRQLQASNQASVDSAVNRMERSLETRLGEFEGRVSGMDDRVAVLEKQIEELLRQGSSTPQFRGLAGDDSARRARTLVFGGWARDSRRRVILEELKSFLESLKVADLFDSEPFTTGARRSMALCGFQQRATETFSDMRARMHRIVVAFSKGGLSTKAGGRAWCSYSKTKQERAKGSHAGWIKRAVSELKPEVAADLEIEWQSGSVWLEDTLLGSSDLPVPPGTDMRGVLVNEDQEGKPWVSVKLLARDLKLKDKDVKQALEGTRVEVQDLPQLISDAAPSQLEKGSLVVFQEFARQEPGWSVATQRSWTVLSHRHACSWRGCGIMFEAADWCVLRRVYTQRGVWFKMRARDADEALWVGTCHFTPGCTVAQFEEEAEDHFHGLPKNATRVVFQGDVNTPFGWVKDEAAVTPIAREGKGGILLKILQEKGHRVVCKSFGVVSQVDHQVLCDLARTRTKPAPSLSYRDPENVKVLFRRARVSGSAASWKEALKARKVARKHWEEERVLRAAAGDWDCLREVRGNSGTGWQVEFSVAQQDDPHRVIHDHFQEVYRDPRVSPPVTIPTGDVEAFTLDELWTGLKQLKGQKAVGCDLTSKELLVGICNAEGGAEQVLEFYNRVLATASIPEDWNTPLLIMLPKVAQPRLPRELRPIALGSSVGKLFSRLLLNRSLHRIRLLHPPQCAGVHRQTNDYTYTLIRLFELEREWQGGMAAIKVDISRAFDDVDRDVLLTKLESKLGPGAEIQCWKALLANNAAVVSSPFGESTINMSKGIKQGGIESPAFYGMLMELAAHEAAEGSHWGLQGRLYPDLGCPDVAMFMDDGVLWTKGTLELQKRIKDFARTLLGFGLKVNIAKCQLYCSPKCQGPRQIQVDGTVLLAGPHLDIMGLRLSVGQSICSLISPLMTRCRAKFWEVRHVLRSSGPLLARVRLLQRIVGASALWCIASVPPDRAAMSMANSVQLQLLVWLLRQDLGCGKQLAEDIAAIFPPNERLSFERFQECLQKHEDLGPSASLQLSSGRGEAVPRTWAPWARRGSDYDENDSDLDDSEEKPSRDILGGLCACIHSCVMEPVLLDEAEQEIPVPDRNEQRARTA